jgi:hypothetical protein
LIVLAFCFLPRVFSQEIVLTGTVKDTSEQITLSNASIVLLKKQDSVFIASVRADKGGYFILRKLPQGEFLVMVTYPGYADYMDEVTIADRPIDLGSIDMTLKSKLLQEVIVTRKLGAIRIKGDTIEYKADSFYLASGATVEQLLKKLPGLQVDRNGKITAQGQTVQKILIDGEEFFSDDPTIVTRGLTADVVDKVQVYDKASEQAEFTGISDGKKTKTIDLKLKEERKNGYFGKLELGSNACRFWNNNVILNAFKGKRKFAAFGSMSSTGETGFGLQEGVDFGGSASDGGAGGGGDWGQGFPRGWSGGLHYSNRWLGDKMYLNSSYKYDKLNTEANGTARSQYILPDTLYFVNESGNSYSRTDNNSLNAMLNVQIDSFSSVMVHADGAVGYTTNLNSYYTESLDGLGNAVNNSRRFTSGDADKRAFNSSILWARKFRKPGRTISLFVHQGYGTDKSTGHLQADNQFFESQQWVADQLIDQQKLNDNITSGLDSRFAYTEPLSKRSLLQFDYSLISSNRRSKRTTLDKDSNGKYAVVVDSLSNDYRFNVLTNAAGITYRYAKSTRFNFSLGMNVSQAGYTRNDLGTDSATRYSFTNFFPQARLELGVGQGANLSFSYEGSTQAPSIDHVQPVTDNIDPLNIRVGNPALKQAFTHNVGLAYSSFKLLSERSIQAYARLSAVQNAFGEFNWVDSLGRRMYQPVNVNGNRQAQLLINYMRKIKKPGIMLGAALQMNTGRIVSFVNAVKNISNNYVFSIGPTLAYDKEKQFLFQFNYMLSLNSARSSVRSDIVTKYWTQSCTASATLFLPWKLELTNDWNIELRQKTGVFDRNNNMVRWNARLARKIFKNDAARIGLAGLDLLNQNLGLTRNITNNFISERTYSNIRRLFMLSFIWNFNKN